MLAALSLAPSASADLTASCAGDPAENLRGAIRTANGSTGPTTIHLESCAYDFTFETHDGINSALPVIRGEMTLLGPVSGLVSGHAKIRRTGSALALFRIFVVASGGKLTLKNVLVSGGHAANGPNGDPEWAFGSATSGGPGYDGGALHNEGTVVIEDARFDDNQAGEGGHGGTGSTISRPGGNVAGNGGPGGKGGTFYNTGTFTIRRSLVTYGRGGNGSEGGECNRDGGTACRGGNGGSGGGGGGLFNATGAKATVELTAFYKNAAGAAGAFGKGSTGDYQEGWGGNGSSGGAIESLGTLTVEDSTIDSNEASDGAQTISGALGGGNGGFGGGIAATQGTLTIRRSTISSNRAGRAGGSRNNTLEGQPGGGGGLYMDVVATIENSTIAGNSAGNFVDCASASDGGGLYAGANANVTLRNVTVSGNTLPWATSCTGHSTPAYATAASIFNSGRVSLANSILSNAAWKGRDVDSSLEEMPLVEMANCGGGGTLEEATSGHNISWSAVRGTAHAVGFGCPGLLEKDPKLPAIPKSDTIPPDPFNPQTLAPGAGSAAVNAGQNTTCLSTDQDLVTRPQGPSCDLGAVESLTTIVQHPAAVAVDDASEYSFTAIVNVHELGQPGVVKWQTSTNGTSWQDGVPDGSGGFLSPTTTLTEDGIGRWKSTATFPPALPSQTGLLFRAVFLTEVYPDGLATNGARLTVRVRFIRITRNLTSLTANNGSLFHIPFGYEAYPAVETVLWEVWKGTSWETLQSGAGSTGGETNHSDTATLAMNGWKYRVTLSGGYPGRPSVMTDEATLTVTNVQMGPSISRPTDAIALDGDATKPAQFLATVSGNPAPSIFWRMQVETGGTLVELQNGDPSDPDAFHYNTTPSNKNSALLWFRAWGDQDLRFADAAARNVNGVAQSERAQLFVRTNTATTLDCPSQALFLSTYTCSVTVSSVPADPARPRARKPCGEVFVRGQVSEKGCYLDANGSCDVTFSAPGNGWTSVVHDAIYLGGGDQPCAGGSAPPDVSGQTASVAEVQLTDCVKPTITSCPAPVTVDGDASCAGRVPDLLDAVGLANAGCQATLAQEPPAGALLSGAGAHDVTITAQTAGGSASCKVRVTVRDTAPPVIQMTGANPLVMTCGEPAALADGVSASDVCDGEIAFRVEGAYDLGKAGTYVIRYVATDSAGNAAEAVQRTLIVKDETAPVVTLIGPATLTLGCGEDFQDPGAFANDTCQGLLPVATSGSFDRSTPGTYTLTYEAEDSAHNKASVTRTITVVDDQPPAVQLNGPERLVLDCGAPFEDPGVTASDACAGDDVKVTVIGTVNTSVAGSYHLRYEVKDPSGNVSGVARLVVVQGSGAPSITIDGPNPATVECHSPYADPGASAKDSCGNPVPVTASGSVNADAPGSYQISYTATNGGATQTVYRTVNVVDSKAPVLACPASITVPAVAGSCGAPVTFSVGVADSCDGAPRHILSHASGSVFPLGTTTVNATATDASGNSSSCSFTVTVIRTSTTTTLALQHPSRQYSDSNAFTATVKDTLTTAPVSGGTVTFKLGSSTIGTSTLAGGVATLSLDLVESAALAKADLAPGNRAVTATYNGDAACYGSSSASQTLEIKPEDARTSYTGGVYASTSCATCGNAVVTLSATVWDISATSDAFGDATPGDIRNAKVTFVKVDGATETPIATVNVGLVSAADTKIGAATFNWNVDIGSSDSEPYTIGVRVGSYYARSSSNDYTVVTVSKPIGANFITGGGYLVLSRSAGLEPGDAGSKSNFGFNVKYNKSGSNLQGRINTLLRRKESDGIVHVYQIKGNAMTSLTVNAKGGTAVFNGKANITDVTNPLAPITADGNGTLTVTMTDKGEPGSSDSIGISLYNKDGGLWFSSSWNGTATVEQVLGGGNLVVR